MSRLPLQTDARAGTMQLIEGYKTAGAKVSQSYRARPTQIKPPCVFIDTVSEDTTSFTQHESQRTVRIGVRCVWGVYDGGPTVDARDAFIDGFYGYVTDNYHAFGGNAECEWIGTADDENWSPDWIPADTSSYFSTLITLEGRAST